MALSDLLRAILALFGRAPAAASAAPPASATIPPDAHAVTVSARGGTENVAAVPQNVPVVTASQESVLAPGQTARFAVPPAPHTIVLIGHGAGSGGGGGEVWLALCRPLSQHFENCYLTAYPDPASPLGKALQARSLWYKVLAGAPIPSDPALRALSGAPWTCGWGSTGPDVCEGTVWTQATADARHDANLTAAAELVDRAARAPLSPQQKAAMTSIMNNVGPGRVRTAGDPGRDGIVVLANGQPSTLLRHLNVGDYAGAADQFLVWNRAGGVVVSGLVRRRAAERDLFLTGKWSAT